MVHVRPDGELVRLARQQVSNRVALTGQLVPAPIVADAGDLLACIWTCGHAYGVTAAEWRHVAQLPQVCVDVLILASPDGDRT
jgi:hypothetical protein